MHKFPALNLNKNANETLWVLMMQRGRVPLFLIFFFLFAQERWVVGWGVSTPTARLVLMHQDR